MKKIFTILLSLFTASFFAQVVQKELHLRLKGLRTKYGDSDELDQMHLKRYLSSGNN